MGFVTCRHVGEALINWLETNTTTNIETVRELVRLMDLGDHRLVSITRAGPASSVVNFTVNDPSDPLTPPIVIPFDFGDLIDDAVSDGITIPWDQICGAAELVSDPDGHTVLLCGPGGIKKILPDNLLAEMCFNDVPDLGAQCGTVDQLVLITEDGCGRLAKTRTATQPQESLYFAQVAVPRIAQNTADLVLPDDFPNPTNYYTIADYIADGGVNTTPGPIGAARPAPGLDAAKINNSRFGSVTFDNPCLRAFEFEVNIAHVKAASVEEAYNNYSAVGFRWRVGSGAWQYPFSAGLGTLNSFAGDNGIAANRQVKTTVSLPAGQITFEVFYMSAGAAPVKWVANTMQPGFGVASPRAFLRRMA